MASPPAVISRNEFEILKDSKGQKLNRAHPLMRKHLVVVRRCKVAAKELVTSREKTTKGANLTKNGMKQRHHPALDTKVTREGHTKVTD